MEMHQVRYFLASAEALNFTRAAEDCGISQPALTRGIQKLEEELGGSLFRRERSRTHLTDLGRLMRPFLQRALDSAEAAKAVAQSVSKAEVAPLALGLASNVESDALDAVVAEIGQNLPGFELSIKRGSSEELVELGLGGALDLLIIENLDEAPERLESWSLYKQTYHVLTRQDHPLATATEVALDALREEVWIDDGGQGLRRLAAHAETFGFSLQVRHRAGSRADLVRLIRAGLGSAFTTPPRRTEPLAAFRVVDFIVAREVMLGAIAGRKRSVAAAAFIRAARARGWEAA
jgi:DNA-binding transcriptional LysR family regulator